MVTVTRSSGRDGAAILVFPVEVRVAGDWLTCELCGIRGASLIFAVCFTGVTTDATLDVFAALATAVLFAARLSPLSDTTTRLLSISWARVEANSFLECLTLLSVVRSERTADRRGFVSINGCRDS
jgi:hypothetical protein